MVSPRSADFPPMSSVHFLLLSLLIWLFLFTEAYILQLLSFLLSHSPTTHLLLHSIPNTWPLPLQPSPNPIHSSLSVSWPKGAQIGDKGNPGTKVQLSDGFSFPTTQTLSSSFFSLCPRSVTTAMCTLNVFSITVQLCRVINFSLLHVLYVLQSTQLPCLNR